MEELFQELENNKVYSEELQTEVIPVEVVYDIITQMMEQHIQSTFNVLTNQLQELTEDFKDIEEEC